MHPQHVTSHSHDYMQPLHERLIIVFARSCSKVEPGDSRLAMRPGSGAQQFPDGSLLALGRKDAVVCDRVRLRSPLHQHELRDTAPSACSQPSCTTYLMHH